MRKSLCPECGQWHNDYQCGIDLCRHCWLESSGFAFQHAIEQYRVWYKGIYGEAAYYHMRERQEARK